MTIDDYLAGFDEEPGYLDFARVGPIGHAARAEQLGMTDLLARARFGSVERFADQHERMQHAVSALTRFPADQVVFQPNTSQGLMHALFGVTGTVAVAPSEFPSLTFAAARAHEALGAIEVQWLDTDEGRVTPGNVRDQLTDATVAVAVSLVDYRTGYLADIDGIRQVIGDRLLIVDAIQGFGIVDAPFEVADVVASGGQKWVRAGWGTGFLALSDRAIERLTPVFSGFTGAELDDEQPVDDVPHPVRGAQAFTISNGDPMAQARLSAALEDIAAVGVGSIHDRVLDRTEALITLADEFGLAIASSRAVNERAGIVVLAPEPGDVTVLAASLHNHGVSCTIRGGVVRLSAHASTSDETLDMVRGAFTSYASAVSV